MKWSLLSATRRLCFVKPATYIKQEIAILDSESVVLVSSESTFYLTDKWTNLLKPTLHFYTDSHNRRWDIKFHEPLAIFPHINKSQMCEILMCFPTMKAMMTPDQFIMLVNGRCKYDHPFLYLTICSVAGFIFGLRNVHSYCLNSIVTSTGNLVHMFKIRLQKRRMIPKWHSNSLIEDKLTMPWHKK